MSPDRRNEDRGEPDRRKSVDVDINELLARIVEMGASDLHIKVGRAATARVDGSLELMRGPAMTEEEVAAVAEQIMPEFRL